MVKQAKHIRISEQCLSDLYCLMEKYDLHSLSATIEFLVQDYSLLQQEQKQIAERLHPIERITSLNKKYLNELRRYNFLLLELLNAICMQQNVSICPPHMNKDFRSQALQIAYGNLDRYMQDVLTKNKEG